MRGAGWIRKRRLVRVAVALAGAVCVWLMLVPPAEASWTPVSNVTAAGWSGIGGPAVAADRQGDFLLAWTACDCNTATSHPAQARIMQRDGSMDPVMTLSAPTTFLTSGVAAATGDAGDSAVVWYNLSFRIQGRRISATGSLGPLQNLSPKSASAASPQIASTPSGDALVAWTQYTSGTGYSTVARYFYKDGSLGPLLALGSSDAFPPAVAIDRLGTAVVAWTTTDNGVVARRITAGSVSPLQTIMGEVADGRSGEPRIAVNEDGDAVVCFWQSIHGLPAHVWARRWSHTGSLGTVLRLSSGGTGDLAPAVASDFAGDTAVVWARPNSAGQMVVFGRLISATDTLGPTTRLGMGDYPAVAMDDLGDGLAVWHTPGPAPTNVPAKVYGREISQTGGFGPKTLLSSDGRYASTASTPSGHFSVAWQQSTALSPIQARFGP